MRNIEMDDLSLDKLDMGSLDSPEMLGTEAAEWKKKEKKSSKPSFGDFDELDLPESTGADYSEYEYVEVTNEDIDRRGVPRGSSFGAPSEPEAPAKEAPAAAKAPAASQFNSGLPNQAEIARNAFQKKGIEVDFVKKGDAADAPAAAPKPAQPTQPAQSPLPPKPAPVPVSVPKLSDSPKQVSIPGLPDLPPRPSASPAQPAAPAAPASVPVSVPGLSDTPKQVSIPGLPDLPKRESAKTEIEIPSLAKQAPPEPVRETLPPEPEPEPEPQSVMIADMDAPMGGDPMPQRRSSGQSARSSSSGSRAANDPAARRASKMNDGFDDFVVPYNNKPSGANQQVTRENMLDIIQQQNIAEYEKGEKKVTVLAVLTIISGVITIGGALGSLRSISGLLSAAVGVAIIVCGIMFLHGNDWARKTLGIMHAYDFASSFIAVGASIGLLSVLEKAGADSAASGLFGTLLIGVSVINLVLNGVLTYFYIFDDSVKRFTGGR